MSTDFSGRFMPVTRPFLSLTTSLANSSSENAPGPSCSNVTTSLVGANHWHIKTAHTLNYSSSRTQTHNHSLNSAPNAPLLYRIPLSYHRLAHSNGRSFSGSKIANCDALTIRHPKLKTTTNAIAFSVWAQFFGGRSDIFLT